MPFYAIGEATASAAAELRAAWPSRLIPGDIRGQAQSGTADQLAYFILNDLSARVEGSTARRLLYLTGDKNRDTLPNILTSGGIVLDALQVYATHSSPSFPHDLKNAIENVQAGKWPVEMFNSLKCRQLRERIDPSQSWGWVVFFAPSAAEQVLPTLLDQFQFQGIDSSTPGFVGNKQRVRIAVIGPTTASFMRDTLKLHVDVVAPRPTSKDLASAIAAFDGT